jgi:hypothetical protein
MSTQAPIETDRLVRTFIKIRAARGALKRSYEEEDGDLQLKLKAVENELLRRAQEQNVEGFKTADGTTYISEERHASIADADEFTEFVKKTGDVYFYEQRPSLGHITEYQAAHDGALPPGVRMFREFRMRVRASKKKGVPDDN